MKFLSINVDASLIHGFESPAADYSTTDLDLNELLIENANSTFIVRVSGNSMEGVNIHDNDLLIVNRKIQARHNSIVVAVLNGVFTVKMLDTRQRALVAVSRDGNQRPRYIGDNDVIQIEGVVTSSITQHLRKTN